MWLPLLLHQLLRMKIYSLKILNAAVITQPTTVSYSKSWSRVNLLTRLDPPIPDPTVM
jgi:hypothetical protein